MFTNDFTEQKFTPGLEGPGVDVLNSRVLVWVFLDDKGMPTREFFLPVTDYTAEDLADYMKGDQAWRFWSNYMPHHSGGIKDFHLNAAARRQVRLIP